MSYVVNLEVFEGPLDLLLWLVQNNNLDIYDIEISEITSQFLKYIEQNPPNLEVAGEFLSMASYLLRLKAKLLLPKESEEFQQALEEKKNLEERLKVWKKIKKAREFLIERFEERKYLLSRDEPMGFEVEERTILSIFDLLEIYKQIQIRNRKNRELILGPEIYLDDVLNELSKEIEERKKLGFFEVAKKNPIRLYVAVLFLAILEMANRKFVKIRQRQPFADFIIEKANGQYRT